MEGTILLILSVLKSYSITDAAFTYTPLETGFCESTNANLTWVFDNAVAQSSVEWTVNDTISIARLLGGSTFIEGTGYNGKLQNDGNGGLIIKGVTPTDSGKYKCVVSYNDATPQASNEQTVTIYRTLNTQVDISEEKKGSEEAKLTSSLVDPSITYTWNSAYSTNFPAESYITVKKNGEYRLCISGGKAKCLNQTLSNCANHTVSGLEACGSFHCGFWLLLLVHVVTSIIISILMWKKVKRFGFSASGCSNMKIGITAVFSVVAIGTGIGLGLGLREGQANCLECEATVGISIALGVILSVGQFILFICCCKEKGCDGNSEGETSDRSNGDRARTPASATGINLEAKKKSQNKPTEKGTEASSLTAKTFGQPLPDTPNARKHQLEPLKTDSFEVENSTTEKKKKKKRKKKKETSEGNEASEEKEERPELEF